MKKNLTTLYSLICLTLLLGSNTANAQCIPTTVATVSGAIDTNNGSTFSFTAVPTGNVITLIVNNPNELLSFDLCSNAPDGWADGTADSNLTILDINGPGATSLINLDDGCTNGSGPNFWGPTSGVWSPSTAGTYYLYLTEWNSSGSESCIANGVNSYDINISVTSEGPCNAGDLTSPLLQNVCPTQDFIIDLDGTQMSDVGFSLSWDNTNNGGTGSTGGPFTFGSFQAEDFPLSYDRDLNGILSLNGLSPFAGIWEFSIVALDSGGATCDQTAAITVTFLEDTELVCTSSPCDAGIITSPAMQDVDISNAGTFTIALDGSETALGGYQMYLNNASTNGTGGTNSPVRITGINDADFPLIYDNDLNGIFSSNNLSPLIGTWEIKIYAINGIGEDCDSTGVVTVNFVEAPCSETPMNISHELVAPFRCNIVWDPIPGALRYDVHYRITGTTTWARLGSFNNTRSLYYLLPNTQYDYIVRATCDGTWDFATSSEIRRFNTANIPALATKENQFTSETMDLFPNPASDVITLNYIASGEQTSIRITNMLGRTVFEKQVASAVENVQSETIDISNLDDGYYILTVFSGENNFVEKFIKSKF